MLKIVVRKLFLNGLWFLLVWKKLLRVSAVFACYTNQLMHYSHFITHSLQHLKQIKCSKHVCKYKTPTCSGIFFTTIFRGSSAVLCAVTIPTADLRSLSLYYCAVCGRMCMSSERVCCSCLLVICLCEFTSRLLTEKNTKHAQISYTCGHIPRNNTNSTKANQQEE